MEDYVKRQEKEESQPGCHQPHSPSSRKNLTLSVLIFWLRQEAQEVTLCVCVSVCLSVRDICALSTLPKWAILRLVGFGDQAAVQRHQRPGGGYIGQDCSGIKIRRRLLSCRSLKRCEVKTSLRIPVWWGLGSEGRGHLQLRAS